MINVSVADTAMHRGWRDAILVAVGACLIEFFQAYFSILLTHQFVGQPRLELVFNILATVVFVGLSGYYFFLAPVHQQAQLRQTPRVGPFWKGIILSSLNFLAYPYWVFYGAYLGSKGWLPPGQIALIVFATGTFFGTFLCLMVYARLGRLLANPSPRLQRGLNWTVGLLFAGFGGFQIYKFLL